MILRQSNCTRWVNLACFVTCNTCGFVWLVPDFISCHQFANGAAWLMFPLQDAGWVLCRADEGDHSHVQLPTSNHAVLSDHVRGGKWTFPSPSPSFFRPFLLLLLLSFSFLLSCLFSGCLSFLSFFFFFLSSFFGYVFLFVCLPFLISFFSPWQNHHCWPGIKISYPSVCLFLVLS